MALVARGAADRVVEDQVAAVRAAAEDREDPGAVVEDRAACSVNRPATSAIT